MIDDRGFRFENSYINLPESFYTRLNPTPVKKPEMVILNKDLAAEMGLNFSTLSREDMAALFSGNSLPKAADPIAQAYAGHQFGHFTRLGDGRALVWGEHILPNHQRVDIQFKGSGRTPYSRGGDGRAALGPMLREYLISEAMHQLGIPTTRSLAVAITGEIVMRDTLLPGAVLTRVASSHIRVGTFEFAAASGNNSLVRSLMEYTINRHYPHLNEVENKAIALLDAFMTRQADLIVHWMRVGFIHGVMNTDNMALSGETIDYGPCAYMDTYNKNTVFSSIDRLGRYAYANQPKIAQWNIARFAESLLGEIAEDLNKSIEIAKERIDSFVTIYENKWLSMMRNKLGLFGTCNDDAQLIFNLLDWMQNNHADFTHTFHQLSNLNKPMGQIYEQKTFAEWYDRWQVRLAQNNKPLPSSKQLMKRNNPAVIPRNHKVEEALHAAASGDMQTFYDLLAVLKKPYQDDPTLKPYQSPPEPSEHIYQTFCGT